MNYHYNPQMNWMMVRFKNYPKFLDDLQLAIANERKTINFYTELYKIAPTEFARHSLKTALDDEKIHDKKLTKLYKYLTGSKPNIDFKDVEFNHFYDGLQKAFIGEIEAAEFYKEMYLSTNCQMIRDLLYSIQHDESEHAALFNWTFTEIK
ncbi:hypothetical protein BHF71_06960 [Vulcanibacillus modesticaldus]|uniref:Rubrerythrin diiron-binding domain-containing protein n=1 Tax=Vulcanibacillus modesticaldus TaxID=337097 RepID=A0A1D2YW93_9BACI|nr:ferritin-like domain-containing protein [Vulcanibacillus modesticaldus]OEG00005.1 hypothetical protein BHF71_06960 [Vulcanibacillus modesticaldus]